MRRTAILVCLIALFTLGASMLAKQRGPQWDDPLPKPFTGPIEVSVQDMERTCHAIRNRNSISVMQSRATACLAYIEALRYNREILAES